MSKKVRPHFQSDWIRNYISSHPILNLDQKISRLVTELQPTSSWNQDHHDPSAMGFVILAILRFSALFLKLSFRAYVYFTLTDISKCLINTKSVVISFFGDVIFAILVPILIFRVDQVIPFLCLANALKILFISTTILLNSDGATNVFINNLKDISENSKDIFTMTRSRLLMLFDLFRTFSGFNQNNPHDVVV